MEGKEREDYPFDIWPLSVVVEVISLNDYVSWVSNKLDKKENTWPIMNVSQNHLYHLIDPSPWPLLGSLGALASTINGVMYMHYFAKGWTLLSLGLGMIWHTMFIWRHDIIHESIYKWHHTFVVQLGLHYGMILFIVFEVMSLLAFFWVFFHSSLAPMVNIGDISPPKGIDVFYPWGVFFF